MLLEYCSTNSSFYISDINGQTYYFNANATKHLEELVLHNKKINDSSGLGTISLLTALKFLEVASSQFNFLS